jgi:hypothetical protein
MRNATLLRREWLEPLRERQSDQHKVLCGLRVVFDPVSRGIEQIQKVLVFECEVAKVVPRLTV